MPTSAQRKFSRALELLHPLEAEISDFSLSAAYRFTIEQGEWANGVSRCTIVAEENQPPPDDWPLRVGEIIQNLRSALDHAVWSAWRSVPTNDGEGRHTALPIAVDSQAFTDQAWRLEGVPATTQQSIERIQPYVVSANRPEADGLVILNRLAIIDKHRTLTTVAAAVAPTAIGHDLRVEIDEWDHGTFTPLGSGRNVVSSFTARSAQPIEPGDLQPMYGYQIQIEGYGSGVLSLFVRRVFEVLWEIENGEHPPPGAPYPIRLPERYVRIGEPL